MRGNHFPISSTILWVNLPLVCRTATAIYITCIVIHFVFPCLPTLLLPAGWVSCSLALLLSASPSACFSCWPSLLVFSPYACLFFWLPLSALTATIACSTLYFFLNHGTQHSLLPHNLKSSLTLNTGFWLQGDTQLELDGVGFYWHRIHSAGVNTWWVAAGQLPSICMATTN